MLDPLSALKIMSGPDLASKAGASSIQDVLPKTIPLQDLTKLTPMTESPAAAAVTATAGSDGSSFQNLLGNFVGEVNAKQTAAGEALTGLMSGKNVSLHQAMISMEEASVSFQMMVEVRNKLLDSYQELMRMQV